MMNWQILVVGPYDCVFVGPFRDQMSAQMFRHDQAVVKPQFDFYIMSPAEYNNNLRDYGEAARLTPHDFIYDTAEERTIQ